MFHQNHHFHLRDIGRHLFVRQRPSSTSAGAAQPPPQQPPRASEARASGEELHELHSHDALLDHDQHDEHDHTSHLLAGHEQDVEKGPRDEQKHGGSSTLVQTMFNILTCYVGVGVYALPYAFKQTGLYAGILMMLVFAMLSAYVNQLLVDARTYIEKVAPTGTNVDYPELGKEAFGRVGSVFIATVIVISQIGGCCAYLIFMGSTLNTVAPTFSTKEYIGILMVVVMCLCMLHDLKYLSPVSMFANMVFLVAMLSLFAYGFKYSWHPAPSYDFIRPNVFVGIGSIIFTMAAANLAIPIESSMQQPGKYAVLNKIGVSLVTVLFLLVGIFGFLFYGDDVAPMVINSLPEDDRYVVVIKVFLVAQIVFTYPLQMFPVILLAEEALIHPDSNPYWHETKRAAIRVVLVGFTALIATSLPFFSLVSSLMGALASSMSGFIFPALIYTKIFWAQISRPKLALHGTIVVLGCAAAIISSYYVVANIVACLNGSAAPGSC